MLVHRMQNNGWVELFMSYTGEFDFYKNTRPSGPVINASAIRRPTCAGRRRSGSQERRKPTTSRYHRGPLNTLSNYTQRQDSVGIGLRLASF